MVNNKFHISESERKRIIQNHIVATKKQKRIGTNPNKVQLI